MSLQPIPGFVGITLVAHAGQTVNGCGLGEAIANIGKTRDKRARSFIAIDILNKIS
jgi:hypothetical protein